MTIDAIIAKLTFDAVLEDKKFQIETTKTIDMLAKSKKEVGNDFDNFLASNATSIKSNIKAYESTFNDIVEEGYSLFLDVISLLQEANDVKQDKSMLFIANFLKNNINNPEIYTKNAAKFVEAQEKIADFIDEVNFDFKYLVEDFDDAVNCVQSKEDKKGIVVLANANRFLILNGGKPEYFKKSFDAKIKELGISNERLLANDLVYLRDYASAEADSMREAGLLGNGAAQYVGMVSRYVSMEHEVLLKQAEEKETGQKAVTGMFERSKSNNLEILTNQWDYELDTNKVKAVDSIKTM